MNENVYRGRRQKIYSVGTMSGGGSLRLHLLYYCVVRRDSIQEDKGHK